MEAIDCLSGDPALATKRVSGPAEGFRIRRLSQADGAKPGVDLGHLEKGGVKTAGYEYR